MLTKIENRPFNKYLYANVHSYIIYSYIIYSFQKVDTTQMSMNRKMDKWNVIDILHYIIYICIYIHTYIHTHMYTKEYDLTLKRNEVDICYNMDELWKHYAKWNKPDIKGQILYDSP